MAFQQFPQKGGIPSGETAARPSSPAIGDTFYNGTGGILEIYTAAGWQPCSAPSGTPAVVIEDLNTRAYTDGPAFQVTYTPSTLGGFPVGYTASATSTATSTVYSGTTTSTVLTVPTASTSAGYGASYNVNAASYNGFGSSPYATGLITVTTRPQQPTIGTASTSAVTTDIAITWTLNATGGKNLSAITITPYLNGTTAQTSQTAATTSSTSHTFTGLTSGNAYTFKVKTTSANGDSPESSATNSITVPTFVSVDSLVLAGAGGGGGGGGHGCGGGAGGYRTFTASPIVKGLNYTVTVGAGGAGGTTNTLGGNGGNSTFASSSSTGGGAGGQESGAFFPTSGGSGGGAYYSKNTAGTGNAGGYTPVEGYAGGLGNGTGPNYPSGGGGGAGAVGGAGSGGTTGGNGGTGVASSITGTSVTRGGGGGGSTYSTGGTPGSGGAGGGGAGNSDGGTPNDGGTNLGGGGGGNERSAGAQRGGNGGSGVVILRWLTSGNTISVGAGLTADATGADGSYSYKRFTAGTGTVSFS
jgi:hypothetical protein